MNNAQYINQDSGDTEYYTPLEYVESARAVMGSIDLDPASSELANQRINAALYYTIEDDSLNRAWYGNVWMNHPFSRYNNKAFVSKLISEYELGHVKSACCIAFAATSEKWFAPLLRYPQCFIIGRVNYFLPSGFRKVGVTKGSVVTYLGYDIEKFRREFCKFGQVKI